MDVLKKIKNYTINQRHCLGQGAFGKVFQATSDDGRKVAIKTITQRLISSDRYLKQSLDNQINIMQKLRHPNIVELYDVIITANNIYLVMEFCSGGDLKRYCSTRKITQEIAFNILRQIAKGFQEMNKFGIIHRDLKPANILVHQDTFKLCDFGFAKFFGESARMARTCVGTPIYMSPQVLKQKHYTSKTDIWSLGIMFYQLLFGKLPYMGYNEDELYKNIAKNPLKIPQCSAQATTILKGTLVFDQNSRWGWSQLLQQLFAKPVLKKPGSRNQGLFYDQPADQGYQKLQKRVYQQIQQPQMQQMRMPMNNYFPQQLGGQPVQRRNQGYKRGPINNFARQNSQDRQVIPSPPIVQPIVQSNPVNQRQPEQNPRFFYFVLVQLIVNPIQGSISFDSFLYTLWIYTIVLYQRILQRPQVINIPVYKSVLQAELGQIQNLESQLRVKKQGNLRNIGEIVYQQAKNNPNNKKRLMWLRRLLDKKYSYEYVQ